MFRRPRNRCARRKGKALSPRRSSARRLAIEPLEDRRLLAVFTVTNTNDAMVAAPGDAPGTLRQAIFDANNTPNVGGVPDEIHFEIPGDMLHTIQPLAAAGGALPAITEAVIINGYTEDDAAANGNGVESGLNGALRIELDGSLAGALVDGLRIVAGGDGSRIQGLVINRFGGHGIAIDGASNNLITGNYIGTNAAGDADEGNAGSGVVITGSAAGNRIGGTTASERNLISGNGRSGVEIVGGTVSQTLIQGNLIGTDAAGNAALGNSVEGILLTGTTTGTMIGGVAAGSRNIISGNVDDGINLNGAAVSGTQILGNYIGTNVSGNAAIANGSDGVEVFLAAAGNTIGGDSAAARNLISGNVDDGIDIDNADFTIVLGNFIGTNAAGAGALPNGSHGVEIDNGSTNSVIGGTTAGQGNTIAFNAGDGVAVTGASTVGNAIRGNAIFSNAGLGIDLGNDGVTANDLVIPRDDDEGPNRLQNFPVLVDAALLGSSIALTYRVNTDPSNAAYPLAIDFYLADANNQEGRAYLDSDVYQTTEAELNKAIVITVPVGVTSSRIVATATDTAGNTSEFSAPLVIAGPAFLGSEPTILRADSITNGEIDTYQWIAHSTGKLVVRIDFLHAFGDLDLEVRDRFGHLLAPVAMASSLEQNFEQVIIPVVAGQPYFVRVFGNSLGAEQTVDYSLELENFAAPVPTAVHLDPNSDTGRLNNDLRTADNTPTFFISADVLNFVDTNASGLFEDPDLGGVDPDAIDALTAAEAVLRQAGAAIEVTLVNTSDPAQAPITGFANPLLPMFPTTYVFTAPAPLPDGVYFVTAATRIFDAQQNALDEPAAASGRSNLSPPLWFTVDTVAPSVYFGQSTSATDGLDPASDSGVPSQPGTIIDRITNDTTPTLWGTAEANSTVRVYVLDAAGARVQIGETVATPFAGNNPAANGRWTLTSTIDMNDPLLGFADLDGLRRFVVEAEDVAGNVCEPETLDVFFDTQGPFIDSLLVNGGTVYDLLAQKSAGAAGPTPAIHSLSVKFTDFPRRAAGFDYAAVNEIQALTRGNYRLVGERVGIVQIASIDFINVPAVLGGTVTAAASAAEFSDGALAGEITEIGDVIVFTSGANAGEVGVVAAFDGATGAITLDAALPALPAVGDTFTVQRQGCTYVQLNFSGALPDDRYTFTVFANIRDDAGNRLDGEFPGFEGDPFPSGDLAPGGDFVVQFTTDALPELGVWAAGTVLIDANGDFILGGGDLTFHLGFSSDYVFAGNFAAGVNDAADGFDKLAAYGRVGATWRWMIDVNNDGVPDIIQNDPAGINGLPVAGNFDGDPANGDEVGLFTGTHWYFDTNHDFQVDLVVPVGGGANYGGFPIVGDFDGDGDDDVGTYVASQAGGNVFSIDLNTAPGAGTSVIQIDGVANYTFRVGIAGVGGAGGFSGFPGVRERPVAADMNGDGVDDIGLWVPDGTALAPGDKGEWFFLVSNNDPATVGIENSVIDRIAGGFVSFTPIPFGTDIYAQFGNSFALPLVGNFDPPATFAAAATNRASAPPTVAAPAPAGATASAAALSAPVSSQGAASKEATAVSTSVPPTSAGSMGAAVTASPPAASSSVPAAVATIAASKKKSTRGANTAVLSTPVLSTAPASAAPVLPAPAAAAPVVPTTAFKTALPAAALAPAPATSVIAAPPADSVAAPPSSAAIAALPTATAIAPPPAATTTKSSRGKNAAVAANADLPRPALAAPPAAVQSLKVTPLPAVVVLPPAVSGPAPAPSAGKQSAAAPAAAASPAGTASLEGFAASPGTSAAVATAAKARGANRIVAAAKSPVAAVDAAFSASLPQSSSTLAAEQTALARGHAYEDFSPNDDMDAALELLFAG